MLIDFAEAALTGRLFYLLQTPAARKKTLGAVISAKQELQSPKHSFEFHNFAPRIPAAGSFVCGLSKYNLEVGIRILIVEH